jgi:hypothetical protein
VLIAPAFYLDAAVFRPLCAELRARGFDAALAPVRWFHWTPTLGGRSQRPILDRLDWALEDLCGGADGDGNGPAPVDPITLELPARGPYGFLDFVQEMRDASRGARPLAPAASLPNPPLAPCQKAAVVASSAAGWIARILLAGDKIGATTPDGLPYSGRAYEGAARRAHTLVTLGTPHYSSEPVTRKNIDWVNAHAPGCFRAPDVRYVTVGAGGTGGKELFFGTGDFAYESYKLCSGDGGDDGDGVTPLRCALALEGAEIVRLQGCAHNPPLFGAKKKADCYGEGAFLESWVSFLAPPAA